MTASLTESDLAALADQIVERVVNAVRKELKLGTRKLLTIPEVAALYRMRIDDVRADVEAGLVKCKVAKRGKMVDAADADREWGAQ